MRASFLAGRDRNVAERIDEFVMHRVDLTDGAVLEKGCVYVVPLMERLALPARAACHCKRQELDPAGLTS